MNEEVSIDRTWTLFLDRDGVINKEIVGSYVTRWEDFQFEEKAVEALKIASGVFGKLLVVTNQRGVGKGIMTMEDLRIIHTKMVACIQAVGGDIHQVYAATAIDDDDHNRKPNPGMGLQAAQDFPEINFAKSIMVGNTMSDMEFGKRLGMRTVFIHSKYKFLSEEDQSWVDENYSSLHEWAKQWAPIQTIPIS